MWGRKKADQDQAVEEAAPVQVEGVRVNGPFDVSEREVDPGDYVDFGSLAVKLMPDIEIQLPAENDVLVAVLVARGGSAVELRPFAGSRSAGTWDGVRAEIQAEVERQNGQYKEVDGPFGTELLAQFAATAPDGTPAVQPARFIGVEGPRWVLRATILGEAALEGNDAEHLLEVVRSAIVRRGEEPKLLRESLALNLPEGAELQANEQD